MFLEQSKVEVEESMKHLLTEVRGGIHSSYACKCNIRLKLQRQRYTEGLKCCGREVNLILSELLFYHGYIIVQDLLDHKSQEMQQQVTSLREELNESEGKLSRLSAQEAALVQQSAKASTQLTREERKRYYRNNYAFLLCNQISFRKDLEQSITGLQAKLDASQKELNALTLHFKDKEKAQKEEVQKLQSQLEEKSSSLKDYQMKA